MFITSLVLLVVALVVALAGRGVRAQGKKAASKSDAAAARTAGRGATGIATFLTLVSLLLLGLASSTVVPTKTVGIVVSYGKPSGVFTNGLHFHAPWKKVIDFDASIQTDDHIDTGKKNDGPCTTVRIANQATACVDNSIRWRIKPSAAAELYRDYKDFDNVRRSLVSRDLTAALNEVFSSYDPLAGVARAATDRPAVSLDELGKQVTDKLHARAGDRIEVLSVVIPLVRHDGNTQGLIDGYQAELAKTRIAEQKRKTAENEAAANAALGGSVKDPNVLISKCLDLVREMAAQGKTLPPAFTCFPNGAVSTVPVR